MNKEQECKYCDNAVSHADLDWCDECDQRMQPADAATEEVTSDE